MTVTGKLQWDEGPLSAATASASGMLRYFLYSDDPGNDDTGTALIWLVDNAPDTLFGLVRDSVEVPKRVADNDDPAAPMWTGVAKYVDRKGRKPPTLEPDEDPTADLNTRLSIRSGTGGSLQRTSSLEFVEEVFAAPNSGPWQWRQDDKIKRLLNLQADQSAESASMFVAKGISIPVGTVEIVVEGVVLNQNVDVDGYLVEASLQAGKNSTNEFPYKGFPKRSLKLISFDSSQRAGDKDEATTALNTNSWDITFVFAYSPQLLGSIEANQQGLASQIPLAPGLEDRGPFQANKEGWDYLDVLYVSEEYEAQGGTKFIIPQAKRQSIHIIYDQIDYNAVLKI